MLRWFLRVHNPQSSDHQHLNKAPIKIQSLSLHIGSGSERQSKVQMLTFPGLVLVTHNSYSVLIFEKFVGRKAAEPSNPKM